MCMAVEMQETGGTPRDLLVLAVETGGRDAIIALSLISQAINR